MHLAGVGWGGSAIHITKMVKMFHIGVHFCLIELGIGIRLYIDWFLFQNQGTALLVSSSWLWVWVWVTVPESLWALSWELMVSLRDLSLLLPPLSVRDSCRLIFLMRSISGGRGGRDAEGGGAATVQSACSTHTHTDRKNKNTVIQTRTNIQTQTHREVGCNTRGWRVGQRHSKEKNHHH